MSTEMFRRHPGSMAESVLVDVDGVSKSFRSRHGGATVQVLEAAWLTVRAGEKVSVIGASGSGKSTLLGLIAGLLWPDEGAVRIDGVDLAVLDDGERAAVRSRRIGMALQSDNLIPFLSAAENVELALGFGAGIPRRERRVRVLDLLDTFGVVHRAGHRPRHLSGGEAQRVALAVSLANAPALLLADEVVAQLDSGTAGQVIDHVLGLDAAAVYVTHEVALADRAETRYELVDGKLVPR